MAEEEAVLSCISDFNRFLCNVLLENNNRGKENFIFSPIVMQTFLSSLSRNYYYKTRNSLHLLLMGYSNQNVYFKCFKEYISFIYSFSKENLSLDTRLFVRDNLILQKDYKDLITKLNYDIEFVDFSNTKTSAELIDSWFQSKTGGMGNLISSDKLKAETDVALLHAIHLKTTWKTPFILAPKPFLFHINEDSSIEVPMMHIMAKVCYPFEEGPFEAVELPFTSEDLSLLVVLPNRAYETNDLSLWSCLDLIALYEAHSKHDESEEFEVVLPRFKMEDVFDFRHIFPILFIREHFGLDILESDEFLKYGQIDHKMFISVDENGVEATSGLVVTMIPVNLEKEVASSTDELKISEMSTKTNISNRFAKTLVTCKIQNHSASAKETYFTAVLPETAFITEFVLEIDGKSYKSYIKDKEEARNRNDEAVPVGRSAEITEADTRDSTQFKVSVNLEPHSEAIFLLTYEEMLQRFHDQYELVLNICPGRLVDNLNVEVDINESSPLKFVKTPPIRSGKEFNPELEKYLAPSCDIHMINSNSCMIKCNINMKEQIKLRQYLETPLSEGFTGQFVVQSDVERDPTNGEILLNDGYFVHFFAPNDLDPLPKHVVFVLDTSSSMNGNMDQVKDAMISILNDIREGDMINIIEFKNDVIVWDIMQESSKKVDIDQFNNFEEPFSSLDEIFFPNPTVVNNSTLSKAKNIVQKIESNGASFLIGALEIALYLVNIQQSKNTKEHTKYWPIIVLLTDRLSSIGNASPSYIVQAVTNLNSKYNKVPIFPFYFDKRADKPYLKEFSLKNYGFSRQIYEDPDASLQLQSFYKQISSPLLSDINFKYETEVTEVTRSHFPIYFRGSELIVSGICEGSHLLSTVNGHGLNGYLNFGSIIQNPVTSLERLWAYLTIKQLLEERNIAEDKTELTKRAADLALKYSFVTEVTSLVVVTPNEICDTNSKPDDWKITKEIRKKRRGCWGGKRKVARDIEHIEVIALDETAVVEDNEVVTNLEDEEITSNEIVEIESDEDTNITQPEQPKELKFIADHPFLVALVRKKEDKRIILFAGQISRPLC